MLYTRKGDDGTTGLFNCDQRFTKNSDIAEALGSVDELNSFLGLCKVKSSTNNFVFNKQHVDEIVNNIQQNLFIIQAELAGADKHITQEKIIEIEKVIDEIGNTLPPISSFFVSGGTELAAMFDIARTVARRAERSIVAVYVQCVGKTEQYDKNRIKNYKEIHQHTLAYANRLSSLLYALARFANHVGGVDESSPTYK